MHCTSTLLLILHCQFLIESVSSTIRLPDYSWRVQTEWDTVYADLSLSMPSLVTSASTIGTSVEGRDIHVVCVGTTCANEAGTATPALLLTSLLHSREPLGALVNMRMATSLVARAVEHGDVSAAALLATRRLIIVPNANPDGYSFNIDHQMKQSHAVMQRKNRRNTCPSGTYFDTGVDLNRNFDFKWSFDDGGSSPQSCAEDFRGSAPFSEPETINLASWIAAGARASPGSSPFAANPPPTSPLSTTATLSTTTIAHAADIAIALNWHSYGRFVNVPWAVRDIPRPPPDTYAALLEVARRIAAAGTLGGGKFGFGHPYDGGLYTCNGEASDWMVSAAGILAYSPELGPEFEREPFEEGMWPKENERPSLIAEGMRMAETALWAAGPLPEITSVIVTRTTTESGGGTTSCDALLDEQCALLHVEVAVTNAGARPHRGDIVVGVFPSLEKTTVNDDKPTAAHACWPSATSKSNDICYTSWAQAVTSTPSVCLLPTIDTGAQTWGSVTATAGAGRRRILASRILSDEALDIAGAEVIEGDKDARSTKNDDDNKAHGARGRIDLTTNPAFLAATVLVPEMKKVESVSGTNLRRRISLDEGAPLPNAATPGASAVRLESSRLPPFHSLPGIILSASVREIKGTSLTGCPLPRGADGSLLRIVISDLDLCSIYAVGCNGALALLHRGLSGCMPCAAYRVAANLTGNQSIPMPSQNAGPPPFPSSFPTVVDDSTTTLTPNPLITNHENATLGLISTTIGCIVLFGAAVRYIIIRLQSRGWVRVPTTVPTGDVSPRVSSGNVSMFANDPSLRVVSVVDGGGSSDTDVVTTRKVRGEVV